MKSGCGAPGLDGNDMAGDMRLRSVITEAEIREKVRSTNERVAKEATVGKGPVFGLCCCGLIGVVIFSVMMALFLRNEVIECDERNGVCAAGADPLVDECCVFWCCAGNLESMKSDATLRLGPERPYAGAPWDVWGDPAVVGEADVCHEYESDEDVEDEDTQATRSCKYCGGTESEDEGEDEGRECVTMSDGAASISEAVTWPLVFLIWLLGPWACLIGLAIFFGCKLEGILRSSFDDWRARGIITGCRYCPGGKHRRAYFELYINAALQQPAMMMAQPGGVAMQPMMQPMQGQVMMQPMQGGYVQPPMQGQMMMQQPVQGQMMMQQPVQGQMMMQQPAQGQMMMQQPIQGQVMMEQPAQGIAYAQPVVAQGTVVQCSAVPQTAKYS